MPETVVCLMGPTASGKTALACELVTRFPFEIVSVDSAMIYRGMDIGTAKPDAAELAAAPHHLIDIREPSQSYSAAQFCQDSTALCTDIARRGKIPLLVGGTMMYFQALQQGLAQLPDADEDLRNRLSAEAADKGWGAMHAQLQEQDPVAAARIHPHDAQRIQRALEVYHLTGQTLSQQLASTSQAGEYSFVNLLLMPDDRSWLHARIATRFHQMLEQGFLGEVEQLVAKQALPANCPAARCVGYRQALDYLAGKDDYQAMSDKGIAATRQLAKRQLTWLRHWETGQRFACDSPGYTLEIMAKLTEILDNTPH